MAEVTHSTRRQMIAGAFAAGTLGFCAKPAVAAIAAAEEARQDALAAEIRAIYDAAGPEEKRAIIAIMKWVVGEGEDPRPTLRPEWQANLRAAGLM